MIESPLLGRGGVETEFGNTAGDGDVVEIPDVDRIPRDDGDVVVVEVDHPLGVGKDGRGVRGDDRLPVTHTDHDGAAAPRRDDPARLPCGEHRDAESPLHLMQRVAHGLQEIPLVTFPDKVGEDLGVGLRKKPMTVPLQAGSQGAVVLDDPVVNQGKAAGLVEMRMGIVFRGGAVGGPAGVGDTRRHAVEHLLRPLGPGPFLERSHLACRLGDPDAVIIHDGQTGGVIPPVLQSTKPVDEDAGGIRLSNVSYDSAHKGKVVGVSVASARRIIRFPPGWRRQSAPTRHGIPRRSDAQPARGSCSPCPNTGSGVFPDRRRLPSPPP